MVDDDDDDALRKESPSNTFRSSSRAFLQLNNSRSRQAFEGKQRQFARNAPRIINCATDSFEMRNEIAFCALAIAIFLGVAICVSRRIDSISTSLLAGAFFGCN